MSAAVLLRGGRVIDPSQGIDRVMDVAVRGGRIAALGEHLAAEPGAEVWDLAGKYVCPGLIDLHGHWYEGSAFGIDPLLCLNHGVTTAVDAGTAGFVNFAEFRRSRIETSPVRVLAFVNIAALGIPSNLTGELEDLRHARPAETAAVIQANLDVVLGVKVRQGTMVAGHGREVMQRTLAAARECRVPVMVHISRGAETTHILRQLRPGDIVTHCYQGRGDGLLEGGALLPEALAARHEGVLFDVGHGCGSFRWETARKAFEHFFLPDTISTDLHRYSVERWAIDLPTTMTKFLHLGMPLSDVIRKTTLEPARAMRRDHGLGTLRPGAPADVCVFDLEEGEFPLEDTHMKTETARRRIRPFRVLRAGEVIRPGSLSAPLRPLNGADREVLEFVERSAKEADG
ncbi:MAG TPA: amidohydrolase/deacetylase family metallohydrolase [Bryobacteraceae bacterium]|nr:amidohydrolase/deacetylase family metallohydrolase [Bryobacteraceae bacterium]